MRVAYKVVDDDRTSARVSYGNLKYNKNSTVETVKNSMGIFCFKRRVDAEKFKTGHEIIIRVFGKNGYIPKSYAYFPEEIRKFTKERAKKKSISSKCNNLVPTGTICYESVKVLD